MPSLFHTLLMLLLPLARGMVVAMAGFWLVFLVAGMFVERMRQWPRHWIRPQRKGLRHAWRLAWQADAHDIGRLKRALRMDGLTAVGAVLVLANWAFGWLDGATTMNSWWHPLSLVGAPIALCVALYDLWFTIHHVGGLGEVELGAQAVAALHAEQDASALEASTIASTSKAQPPRRL